MRTWQRFRRRRVLLVLVALCVTYLFVKHLPTDVPSVADRFDPRIGRSQARPHAFTGSNTGAKQEEKPLKIDAQQGLVEDSPVRLENLATSLRTYFYSNRARRDDNILFILHNLQSASTLVPVACEVARNNRSDVHMAVMSRHDASIETIMNTNGIKQADCPIFWHDARPDANSHSSPSRHTIAVRAAIGHLHAAIRPEVIILDTVQAASAPFMQALKSKAAELGTRITVLPHDALNSMGWVAMLNATSLASLNDVQIEIIVQGSVESAGALARLLRSIRNADYTGLPVPKITIELAAQADLFTLPFLENFVWPPGCRNADCRLNVRRRLGSVPLSRADASLRMIETFFPVTPRVSHLLVLNADVELSPQFWQYLFFLLLEYRYGRPEDAVSHSLIGISLETSVEALRAPRTSSVHPIFLSQTPNSNAALYFGEKWAELHSFVANRLKQDPALSELAPVDDLEVGGKRPSWVILMSELMKTQGYYMMYPLTGTQGRSLVTVHAELHKDPEEYLRAPKPLAKATEPDHFLLSEDDVLTGDDEDRHANMQEPVMNFGSTLDFLKVNVNNDKLEALPDLTQLPIHDVQGIAREWHDVRKAAREFSRRFAVEIGGCESSNDRAYQIIGDIGRLFCHQGTRT